MLRPVVQSSARASTQCLLLDRKILTLMFVVSMLLELVSWIKQMIGRARNEGSARMSATATFTALNEEGIGRAV